MPYRGQSISWVGGALRTSLRTKPEVTLGPCTWPRVGNLKYTLTLSEFP